MSPFHSLLPFKKFQAIKNFIFNVKFWTGPSFNSRKSNLSYNVLSNW